MLNFKLHYYQILAIVLLSTCTFTVSRTLAADSRTNSIILNASKCNSSSQELINASIIKDCSFESTQIDKMDLRHVSSGPLSQENSFHLSHGNALFTPKQDIVVLTSFGTISIRSGSVVCVLKPEAGVVGIYNLHSENGKKIDIEIGEHHVQLYPGAQATICYQCCDFESINPAACIAYRNLEQKDLPAGIKVYTAEFSIPSAIEHIEPLRNILASTNKDDHNLIDQMLKDFVITEQLTNSDKPYFAEQKVLPKNANAKAHVDQNDDKLMPKIFTQ